VGRSGRAHRKLRRRGPGPVPDGAPCDQSCGRSESGLRWPDRAAMALADRRTRGPWPRSSPSAFSRGRSSSRP